MRKNSVLTEEMQNVKPQDYEYRQHQAQDVKIHARRSKRAYLCLDVRTKWLTDEIHRFVIKISSVYKLNSTWFKTIFSPSTGTSA